MAGPTAHRRRPVGPLLSVALACVLAFAAVTLAAYATAGGAWLDRSGLEGFVQLQGSAVGELTLRAIRLGDPAQVGLLGMALATIAVARGRPRVAALVVVLLAATSVSSQVLKALLAHSRGDGVTVLAHVQAEALPSGHSTAAMALALAAVLVAPRRARPAAAVVGAALALAVGFSAVVQGWHFPSDVVAGYLLATGWALVLVAGLRLAERRWPAEHAKPGTLTALGERASADGMTLAALAVVVTVVGGGVVVLGSHAGELADYGRDYTAAVAVALGLVAAALALPAAMAAALRRR